jgi:hypothetical protein
MAADRYRFVRRTYDSYELDAIRAIQANNHGPEMELSADYTDYADFVLQLRSCRGLTKMLHCRLVGMSSCSSAFDGCSSPVDHDQKK